VNSNDEITIAYIFYSADSKYVKIIIDKKIIIPPINVKISGISLKNKNLNQEPHISTEYLNGAVNVKSTNLNE
jgi:hypothetical protein